MEPQKNNLKIVADKKNARMILPNMLTLIGVCIGLTSIRFALDEKFELANKVLRDLRKSKVTEQMVVPRGLKKKNPLMTPETEMELLKRLSNRKSFYDRARTGRAMPIFSEENKHRDAKLNYQYKQVTDPKRPVDPIKLLKLKKGTV